MANQVSRVNKTISDWEDLSQNGYPQLRSCIPVIKEKANRILQDIHLFQGCRVKMPDFVLETRLQELNMYGVVCIRRKEELPKDVNKAIEELDREIAIQSTSFDMKQQVTNWEWRFTQNNTNKARDCMPLVQGKAREILGQLKQMKDRSPDELSRVGDKGVQYLDNYAQCCLRDGAKAVSQDLPQDLQSERAPAPISYFMPKYSGDEGF